MTSDRTEEDWLKHCLKWNTVHALYKNKLTCMPYLKQNTAQCFSLHTGYSEIASRDLHLHHLWFRMDHHKRISIDAPCNVPHVMGSWSVTRAHQDTDLEPKFSRLWTRYWLISLLSTRFGQRISSEGSELCQLIIRVGWFWSLIPISEWTAHRMSHYTVIGGMVKIPFP